MGAQNRSKIDQKLKPKMDRLLASIFDGFGGILGGKLGWKIEPRARKNQLKNVSNKIMKKTCVLDAPGGGEALRAHGRGGDPETP